MARTYSANLLTGESINVVTADGQSYTIPADAPNFDELVAAVRAGADDEVVMSLVTPLAALTTHAESGGFSIKVDAEKDAVGVFWEGKELSTAVATMIVEQFRQGLKFDALKNFLIKSLENKTPEKADVLYNFIIANRLPLHEDGDFLAYKTVRANGYDKHSGKVLYQIGKFVSPAGGIDWNEFNQCSQGLHIGGPGYVKSFGTTTDRYFVVKVNPKDCIYYIDHQYGASGAMGSGGKMRVAKLFVYAETAGGDDLLTALPTLVTTIPSGDRLELKEIVAQEIAAEPPTPKDAVKAAKKQKKKAKEAVRIADKASPIKEPAPEGSMSFDAASDWATMEFKTTDGKTFTGKQVAEAVKAHGGQRGAARILGVARTSIQGWLKAMGVG